MSQIQSESIDFDSVEELCLCLYEDIQNHLECVSVIGGFDIILDILEELTLYDDFLIKSIDLDCEYEAEYLMTINDEYEVYIEKLHYWNSAMCGIKLFYSDITYVDGDVTSKILPNIINQSNKVIDFSIVEDIDLDNSDEDDFDFVSYAIFQ